jgi:uncharacterized protein with PIN domain
MNYCFAADRTLGKLAKWLRILGFDTTFESDYSSRIFFTKLSPDRVLLTRTEKIRQQFADHELVFIEANDWFTQLVQIIDELGMTINDINPFSRCLRCNSATIDIGKEDVFGRVPDYTWESQNKFSICRQCEHIFWQGTHTERTREVIERLFEMKKES